MKRQRELFVPLLFGRQIRAHSPAHEENGAETLFTKPIDFGALRSEIDMRIECVA